MLLERKNSVASMLRCHIYICIMSTVFIVSACNFPHKIEIQQGSPEIENWVENISIGMSKKEVLEQAGPPSVSNLFDNNRWYYVYQLRSQGELVANKKIEIVFNANGKVATINQEL